MTRSLGGLLAILLASGLTDSWSDLTARKYPKLAEQKAQLTRVAIVSDIAEFEVSGGKADKVYVEDCRGLAQAFGQSMAAAMAAKGYPVEQRPVLSVGLAALKVDSCRVLSRWAQHEFDESTFPKGAPPFYADSTLLSSPEMRERWQAVLHAAFELKGPDPKHGRLATIPDATGLRDSLGSDYLLVCVGLGTKNPRHHQTMFGTAIMGPAGIGAPAKGAPGIENPPMAGIPDDSPYPGSVIRIVLVDCRDGSVLWADRASTWQGFNEKRVAGWAQNLASAMP